MKKNDFGPEYSNTESTLVEDEEVKLTEPNLFSR